MRTYQSLSSKETRSLGKDLALSFARKSTAGRKGAIVLGLRGDLGAGKTTFVQGFLEGLGSKKRALSPTFIIMRRHALRHEKFSNIFHIDAYRLKKAEDIAALELKDALANPKNIILIEWADRVKKLLPKGVVWLEFRHGKKKSERSIMIKQ